MLPDKTERSEQMSEGMRLKMAKALERQGEKGEPAPCVCMQKKKYELASGCQ